jgi:hypothetical protein
MVPVPVLEPTVKLGQFPVLKPTVMDNLWFRLQNSKNSEKTFNFLF